MTRGIGQRDIASLDLRRSRNFAQCRKWTQAILVIRDAAEANVGDIATKRFRKKLRSVCIFM
jgi:hypothetical protein